MDARDCRRNNRANHPLSPSIDRKDNRIGYTDANIQVVIWQYNAAKAELSDADFLSFCKKVVATA